MTDDRADDFAALVTIYFWRNEPEQATTGVWFWPVEEQEIEAIQAYRN